MWIVSYHIRKEASHERNFPATSVIAMEMTIQTGRIIG
jgi:hypothetical protein